MQLHLSEISKYVARKAHAVVLMDRAGWHSTGKLIVPKNLTITLLPSKSPELPPPPIDCLAINCRVVVENVWQYLRSNHLSNRVFKDYTAIVDAACDAWNALIEKPNVINSIGMRNWAHV